MTGLDVSHLAATRDRPDVHPGPTSDAADREALRLTAWDGLSTADAAAVLGTSRWTCRIGCCRTCCPRRPIRPLRRRATGGDVDVVVGAEGTVREVDLRAAAQRLTVTFAELGAARGITAP